MVDMGHIIGGLAIIAVGGSLIIFHNQLIEMFGDIERAERNGVGTKGAYVLIAMFIIIVGVFTLFGMGPKNPTDTDGIGLSNKNLNK